MVLSRSAAMNRTRPAGMSTTVELAAGVSNFCMVLSFFCSVRSVGPLFLMMEKLRCIHGFGNKLVA
ncbi:hypothetical protein [Streptomyces katrae]|uniref:hypothetical protein n=1 Tax=Streptomyces katrae TaxID=68223 RepID=UPI000B206952|nr:hypothetical protein [Streptomyces katrae]